MRRLILTIILLGWMSPMGLADDFRPSQDNPEGVKLLQGRSEGEDQNLSVENWDNLKNLRVGKKIRVVDADLRRLKGRFVRVSQDGLTFRVKKDGHYREEMTTPRAKIRMVSLRHSKAKEVLGVILLGALIGSGALGCEYCETPTGTEAAIGAGVGALVFGIAAASADPDDQVLYFMDSGKAASLSSIEQGFEPDSAARLGEGQVSVPAIAAERNSGAQADTVSRWENLQSLSADIATLATLPLKPVIVEGGNFFAPRPTKVKE